MRGGQATHELPLGVLTRALGRLYDSPAVALVGGSIC